MLPARPTPAPDSLLARSVRLGVPVVHVGLFDGEPSKVKERGPAGRTGAGFAGAANALSSPPPGRDRGRAQRHEIRPADGVELVTAEYVEDRPACDARAGADRLKSAPVPPDPLLDRGGLGVG